MHDPGPGRAIWPFEDGSCAATGGGTTLWSPRRPSKRWLSATNTDAAGNLIDSGFKTGGPGSMAETPKRPPLKRQLKRHLKRVSKHVVRGRGREERIRML